MDLVGIYVRKMLLLKGQSLTAWIVLLLLDGYLSLGCRHQWHRALRYVNRLIHILSPDLSPRYKIKLLLFGFFAALAIANISSARIASDRVGLSSSQHCGLWEFDTGQGDEPARRDDRHNYQKEAQASQYARACYIAPDLPSTLSCGFFYNQSIAFGTKIGERCPFESQELCFDGLYSAITFDTGPVDASIIGINAPLMHKFRRKTTCSPLNMSEPYITRSDRPTYLYNYGPKNHGSTNHTFQTHGHPFDWLVPVYSVK